MKNKLGIIVPYRDRYDHLQEFLPHMESYLLDKGIEYTIIVVEQDNASAFNRGMLCNIGFLEAKKQKCNYVVFHDVDMLPIDVDYSFSNVPVHLATQNIPYPAYFGGITLFPVKDFEKINGFSNFYWGWGFEDDDLRYRCVNNDISFGSYYHSTGDSEELAIFNGNSSYAKIPNVINYNRGFYIKLDINLDRTIYSTQSSFDIFPLLSIKGYDFKLSYTSFNRFYLQVFDSAGKYYDVFSNITTKSNNKIEIEYVKITRRIKLIVNEILVGIIDLDKPLYNYTKSEYIYFGTDIEKENFFKGTLNDLHIEQGNELLLSYIPFSLDNYEFKDLTKNSNHAKLNDVYLDKFTPPEDYYSYIPHRRESKIKYLPHVDNGFDNGEWKHQTTRWNQLRYNNEVQNGDHDNIEDGLSNCKYTLHGKTANDKYIHLNVGI